MDPLDNTPRLPTRKRLRWRGHDYSSCGAYFVTICVQDMRCIFGRVVGDRVEPNALGRMVERQWLDLQSRYPCVGLDQYIVMPNHLHGIVFLLPDVERIPLSRLVARFKTGTTHLFREGARDGCWPDLPGKLWLRSFHDRVIRDDDELRAVRAYIIENPLRWTRARRRDDG